MSIFKQGFKCWGCGHSGDAIDLVSELDRIPKTEAVRVLGGTDTWHRHPVPVQRRLTTTRKDAWPTPCPERLRVMKMIWRCAEGLDLSTEAERWFGSRAIEPQVAWVQGCRELTENHHLIEELGFIAKDEPETMCAAGLAHLDGKGRARLWWPFRFGNGRTLDPRSRGIAIPIWHPDFTFPLAWRHRLFQPCRFDNRVLKSLSSPRGADEIRADILGARHGGWRLAPITIVCEGEPDYLSFCDLFSTIGSGPRVLGLCSISSGWKPHWNRFITPDHTKLVVVGLHDDKDKGRGESNPGARIAAQIAKIMVSQLGRARASRRFVRRLLSGRPDANDLHQRGELLPWLVDVLTPVYGDAVKGVV